ncbi:MAG TPA: terminase family protein [Candidatus Glassbacteria bacterium]|nr:terminase family protein [Candidatus Glassbacteria bacterium]
MQTIEKLWKKKKTEGFGLELDPWQREVLDYWGNCILRTGRQVGKSTITALKVTDFAISNPGTTSLVIAASQRQSSLLFEKIRSEFDDIEGQKQQKVRKSEIYNNFKTKKEKDKYTKLCSIYVEPPTKTKIMLKIGSVIHCLPAGKSGVFIRGYTIDLLIADEAAYIAEAVWLSIKPMLAVSRKKSNKGWIILLSTPFGKGGYFYDCWHDKDFRQWHVNSEKCPRLDKKFLLKEKRNLTKLEYAQEYLGEFIDEFHQLFPTKLIKERMTFMSWEKENDYNQAARYYLGIDIARFGEDENAFVIAEMLGERVKIVKAITTERRSLTDTVGRALVLHEKYNFSKIFTDDTGIGAGVTDMLKERIGRYKVVGIQNAKKETDEHGNMSGKCMKEDIYSNAIKLMEEGKIDIINSLKLQKSLKSVTFTYTSHKNLMIHGKYDHLAEAFVRACWCVKAKGLKLFVA